MGPTIEQATFKAALRTFLGTLGEDALREGLSDTPDRVVKAFTEMTEGYALDPAQILSTMFSEATDEVILLRDISFVSLCEHHLLPFTGVAHVAYLPNVDKGGRVVGLSKLARLVDCYAKRFQIQERLTRQVAEALMTHVEAKGAACIITAHHSCMSCRGVKKSGARMVTSCMLGEFRETSVLRAELLSLLQLSDKAA